MNGIVLDTSAYSAFLRGHQAIKTAIQKADTIVINPVVLGELVAGFIKGGRVDKNRQELKRFLSSPRVRLVAIDEETAERYAVILNALWAQGDPIPTNDIWIAATAFQHGLALVTTDLHFTRVMQVVVDYHPSTA